MLSANQNQPKKCKLSTKKLQEIHVIGQIKKIYVIVQKILVTVKKEMQLICHKMLVTYQKLQVINQKM